MAKVQFYNLGGLQLGVSPFMRGEGQFIRLVNVDTDPIGAKKKRPGYITYLGTPDNSQINSLWNWTKDDGTTFWNYRASGSSIYYSTQGTGDWTICGNGTISDGAHVGNAVLENTMIIGDGAGTPKYTTSGTSFTDVVGAPVGAGQFTDYQNRIYCNGTGSDKFWSTAGTAQDWLTDSSSIKIPGPGKITSVFKVSDRVISCKNSGVIFRWDGYNLSDLTTNLGPSSPYSLASIEDYKFFLNRKGIFGFGGDRPEIISNMIERQIYNDAGEGIAGTIFDTAPGVTHKYNYYLSAGTITDDLTDETISNCILNYDVQLDEWCNFNFGTLPTGWCSYKDASGNEQLIFGDSSGQCYTYGGTATSDNGSTIESIMEFIFYGGAPEVDKKYKNISLFFNPGCQAHCQVAIEDTFTKGKKNWYSVGDVSSGVAEFRFPPGSQGKLLFVKITEASRNTRFNFYGGAVDFDYIER